MRFIALVLILSAAAWNSQAAAADTMIAAVSFVLTGTDSSDIVAVDRPNCVFDLRTQSANNAEPLIERFHMNNIDLSRLTIQGFHNDFRQRLTEEIRGEGAVMETIGTQSAISHVSQTTLRLCTVEVDRVKRAWNYIYSHGCHSAKASS